MTTLSIILLVIQGLLFAIWAFLMFRALFGILGRYRCETGLKWIGPIRVFSVCGAYLKDPAHRQEKWGIVIVLALFFLVTLLRVKLLTA